MKDGTTFRRHNTVCWLILIIVTLVAFPNHSRTAEDSALDVADFVDSIDADDITGDLIVESLPRESEDIPSIVLRLKGNDYHTIAGGSTPESAAKQYLRIGAYFTAAQWDWQLFMKQYIASRKSPHQQNQADDLSHLKMAMQSYLVQVNHRLDMQKAPKSLLLNVTKLNNYFSPAGTADLNSSFNDINTLFKSISFQLDTFILDVDHNKIGYKVGQWLVWEARLSHIYLTISPSKAESCKRRMNKLYESIDLKRVAELSPEWIHTDDRTAVRTLKKNLRDLDKTFLVKDAEHVKTVKSNVTTIFTQLEIIFPGFNI